MLPAITLGSAASMASMTRMTRSSMLDALSEDYVRTARAEGFGERKVVLRHALSNALIPIITAFGLQFSAVMNGAILTETVFSWPGVGRMIVDYVNKRDAPVVMGTVILLTMFISVANLVIDIVYAFVDPRIKAKYSK